MGMALLSNHNVLVAQKLNIRPQMIGDPYSMNLASRHLSQWRPLIQPRGDE